MTEQTDPNAGSEQTLTPDGGTADGTTEPQDKGSKGDPDPVVQGLNRTVNQQREVIKNLNAKLEEAEKSKEPTAEVKAELDAAKKELAQAKLLAKYPDVADKLEAAMKRGVDPSLIDDDFAKMFRGAQDEETETPAHNPVRGTPTEAQKAANVLKSISSLF